MFLIYIGHKYATMRKTSDRHKVGGVYQVKLNLFDDWAFKVKVISKEYVNLDSCSPEALEGIGYSLEEYLAQPYNLASYSNNGSDDNGK